ncbi:DUF5131 family protein [Streptomyces sp. NPDC088560]|uniref:DUF5131 family protein n=1 Tax=Streptomyces sp. NPDC088560 TaxID=3365868 RepID=UPI00382FC79B
MSDRSAIEWTTWNPATGCDRVTPGCDNCYASVPAWHLKAMGQSTISSRATLEPPAPASDSRCTQVPLRSPSAGRRPAWAPVGADDHQ